MLYVGLDLSIRSSGVVVLDAAGGVELQATVGWGVDQFPLGALQARLAYYVKVTTEIRRLLGDAVNRQDTWVAVEAYAPGAKGSAVHQLAELGGLVRLALSSEADCRCQVREIPPSTVKKFATDKGNVHKDVMLKAVFQRWGFDTDDNNQADAYVLARIAQGLAGPVTGMPQFQRQALDALGQARPSKARKRKES